MKHVTHLRRKTGGVTSRETMWDNGPKHCLRGHQDIVHEKEEKRKTLCRQSQRKKAGLGPHTEKNLKKRQKN